MQNKPNLLNAQMNVNKVLTKDYENVHFHRRGKNKPNTNPINPISKPNKANFKTSPRFLWGTIYGILPSFPR